jgi:hypothetical protein
MYFVIAHSNYLNAGPVSNIPGRPRRFGVNHDCSLKSVKSFEKILFVTLCVPIVTRALRYSIYSYYVQFFRILHGLHHILNRIRPAVTGTSEQKQISIS